MTAQKPPATSAEILGITGTLDDAVLVEIIGIGASAAEVLEAYTWLTADDQIATEIGHGPTGAVLRVLEVLRREEAQEDER